MRNLSEVVLTLGRHGESVIVGRGAFFILDAHFTLRVRCHAPLEWRVAQMAKRRSLSEAEAREMVLRIDAERVDFYSENFHLDVRQPEHFDLVLDTAATSEKDCVATIVEAFETRFGPPKSEMRLRGAADDRAARPPSASTA
jgi:cytidylate kinase